MREWHEADADLFAAMNADPDVMEYFPTRLSREESNALIEWFRASFAANNYCPWAVEILATGSFIGFIGLHTVPSELPFAPAVEVVWRLRRDAWGHGYATEGGRAALDYAFDKLGLADVVSFTPAINMRSRRVMEQLGMSYVSDFDRPGIALDDPLHAYVLYRRVRDQKRIPAD